MGSNPNWEFAAMQATSHQLDYCFFSTNLGTKGLHYFLQREFHIFLQGIPPKMFSIYIKTMKSPYIDASYQVLPAQSRPVSSRAHCRPRVYTKAFGVKIRDLMPALLGSGRGKPELSGKDVSIYELYSKYPWSDWPEANLEPVIRYLRGSRYLDLPQAWRDVLPRKL